MMTIAPMRVNPNDTILIRVTPDDVLINDVKHVFDYLQTQYPNNHCLCIPDWVSLKACSIEELKQIRDELDKIINLQENKNDY